MPYKIYPAVDENNKFPPVVRQAMAIYSELVEAFSGKYLEEDVATHIADVENPHGVTKAQLGLEHADNTSDANKPVSLLQQTELDLKAPKNSPTFTGNVSGVTKSHVGLGNADNTSDADKPVSTLQQQALDLKASKDSPTFTGTVSGITKTHVGLGNVDNTSDAYKPVSTEQAAAMYALAKGLRLRLTTVTPSSAVSDAAVRNIPTYTFLAGRKYRIVWDASYSQSVLNDFFHWTINTAPVADSATSLTNLTVLTGRTRGVTGAINQAQHRGLITAYFAPSADTTLQIKFRVERVAGGTGTVTVFGSAIESAEYMIYDDGTQL